MASVSSNMDSVAPQAAPSEPSSEDQAKLQSLGVQKGADGVYAYKGEAMTDANGNSVTTWEGAEDWVNANVQKDAFPGAAEPGNAAGTGNGANEAPPIQA